MTIFKRVLENSAFSVKLAVTSITSFIAQRKLYLLSRVLSVRRRFIWKNAG